MTLTDPSKLKRDFSKTAHELVRLIYETTEDPKVWTTFLQTLSATVRAPAVFSIHDANSNQGNVVSQVGFDPAQVKAYDTYYHSINPFINAKLLSMKSGATIRGEELCSPEVLVSSEYYQDLLRPYGHFHLVGGLVISEPSLLVIFTMQRSRRLGAYTKKELALIEVLIPHLGRAVRLNQRLNISAGIFSTMEASAKGVIILGRGRQVLYANRVARTILAQNDGLIVSRNGELCASFSQNPKLEELIALASGTSDGNGLHAGFAMAVGRPSGKRAFTLSVSPISLTSVGLGGKKPVAVVFVADPDMGVESPALVYEQLFDLTKSEARLAVLVADGKGIREAADKLGITRNTARTHLQHLFQKVGVKRQGELVSYLLRVVTR